MQTLGLVTLFMAGAGGLTALSVALYSALPETLLAYAERHGRFQGLEVRETLVNGTRAGQPPAGRQMAFAE